MLKHRIASGVTLGILVAAALLLPGSLGGIFATLLLTAFTLIGAQEMCKLLKGAGIPVFPAAVALFSTLFTAGSCLAGFRGPVSYVPDTVCLTAFLITGFTLLCRSADFKKGMMALFSSTFSVLYLGWAMAFIAKIYFSNGTAGSGRLLLLFFVLSVKITDIGAFTVGTITSKRAGGNHKIAPKLSPKKSWEGLIGGIAAGAGTAFLLCSLFGGKMLFNGQPAVSAGFALVFGTAAAVIGFLGDVAESLFKRAAGAKDSGWIPGLGGVLDVIDSLILTAPIFYLWISS